MSEFRLDQDQVRPRDSLPVVLATNASRERVRSYSGRKSCFRLFADAFFILLALFPGRLSSAETARGLSALERRPEMSASIMKKASANRRNDDLRPEYDLTRLAGGVRGKYYRQAIAGTNLVLIEPELTHVFRDSESVNRALRLLANAAEAAAAPAQSRRRAPKKRLPMAP